MVTIGEVYKARMTHLNGITPKNTDTYRDKFFVVLGIDTDGTVYGGVIINSHINANIAYEKQLLQYPISPTKYPFLQHNSFVNCAEIKILFIKQLARATLVGSVLKDDLELIKATIKESPFIDMATLRRFDLL